MGFRRCVRWWTLMAVLALGLGLLAPYGAARAEQQGPQALQAAFAAAANEFDVPESVLLAVSYNVSRWEHHNGQPSMSGGYGLMHLVEVDETQISEAKGDDLERPVRAPEEDPAFHTLSRAAALLGLSIEELRADPLQNIRGGAALLAQYARETVGHKPVDAADWYGAVARYSGSQEAAVALGFADDVYATIKQGASRTNSQGQALALPAQNVVPNRSTADSLHLRNSRYTGAECPNGLACRVIPARYQQNNPNNPGDYGNYDLARREADGLDIDYIVIHDTEGSYESAINWFQNRWAYVSSHYVIRASDGQITQMVPNQDVAWTAGNWYVNAHSINLEHEGVAIEGATWYSEQMYRASARLVRYLADVYDIPLDRAHIIGHDDVPGPTAANHRRMHWDPGPFWDWEHYMALIGAPIVPDGDPHGNIVTIRPNFNTNQQVVSYCFPGTGCGDVEAQPASFVPLYTAPSFDAPLVDDPHLPGPGTNRAYDWGNKAAAGQQFYRFATQDDWDGIYFAGQQAWLYNPGHNTYTVPGTGTLITPKAGKVSIPVYGRAYPEASAYPAGIPVQSIVPLNYSLPAGQVYVAKDKFTGDYYRAPIFTLDPSKHKVVEGQMEYYLIFFGHRLGYVRATDVDVIATP